jgi:hypothetical protein
MKDKMWEIACNIETLSYKIDSIASIVELVAEKTISEPESGALWAASEILRDLGEKVQTESQNLLDLRREIPDEPPKKGKKK